MGRYYREVNQDSFDGKFWLGVQRSDTLTKFGFEEIEPQIIEYEICRSEIETVKEALESIESKHSLLNREINLDILYSQTKETNKATLEDYADYVLLLKIWRAFQDNQDTDCLIIECDL